MTIRLQYLKEKLLIAEEKGNNKRNCYLPHNWVSSFFIFNLY